MTTSGSLVISMRLPTGSERRLKRMAKRHGWTTSDASAHLVEEGLRRAEFAFIDFKNTPIGRQAVVQGSSLAVWEVMMIAREFDHEPAAVAKHLNWPLVKALAAFNYAKAFPDEIQDALAENDAVDFESLKRMLPQAAEFVAGKRPARH